MKRLQSWRSSDTFPRRMCLCGSRGTKLYCSIERLPRRRRHGRNECCREQILMDTSRRARTRTSCYSESTSLPAEAGATVSRPTSRSDLHSRLPRLRRTPGHLNTRRRNHRVVRPQDRRTPLPGVSHGKGDVNSAMHPFADE
jgi:hypothetical protein